MTKIIKIDCEKWATIITLTLWAGFTIGLGVISYSCYQWFTELTPTNCNHWSDGSYFCATKYTNGNFTQLGTIYTEQFLVIFLGVIPTFINACMVWKVVNSELKLIKVECKQKEIKYNLGIEPDD